MLERKYVIVDTVHSFIYWLGVGDTQDAVRETAASWNRNATNSNQYAVVRLVPA